HGRELGDLVDRVVGGLVLTGVGAAVAAVGHGDVVGAEHAADDLAGAALVLLGRRRLRQRRGALGGGERLAGPLRRVAAELGGDGDDGVAGAEDAAEHGLDLAPDALLVLAGAVGAAGAGRRGEEDRKSTRLNSSHVKISYAVFCLKKKT